MRKNPAVLDIDRMPRGGPDASWVDRRLQTDRLEYLDRGDVDDRVKRQVVRSVERLGSVFKDHEKFARLALDEVADIADPMILELGSGHGGLSRKLLEIHPGAQVTVTDIDSTSVAYIAAGDLGRHPRATVRAMDATEIDAADGEFDLVVFAQSFHHLPPPLASRVFAEGTRVADKLLIIDLPRPPSIPHIAQLAAFLPLTVVHPFAHEAVISSLRAYSASAMRALARYADPTSSCDFTSSSRGAARSLSPAAPASGFEPTSGRTLMKEIDMQVGIIGAGSLARAVAAVAINQGHDVMVSNTRGPETLFSLVESIGCTAGTPEEAAAFGDIALVAIPLKAYHTVPVAQVEGKIVLDATNYHPERDGHIDELDRDEITTSDLVARHLPKSTIVKAFNAFTAADIESDGLPSGWPGRRALPIAGDDAVAKKVVAELLDELGYDTVDAGPLVEGRRFQKNTPAYCIPMDFRGLQATVYNTFNPLAPRRTPLAAPDAR